MRICIIGAGAIGSALAVALARAGDEVTILLPPDVLPEGGAFRVTLTDPHNDEIRWAIIPATSHLSEPFDLAILAISIPDLRDSARGIHLAGQDFPILTVQPIPGAEEIVRELLGAGRVIGMLPLFDAAQIERGRSRVAGPLNALIDVRMESSVLQSLRRALAITAVPDLEAERWTRVVAGVPALLSALTDTPLAMLRERRRLDNAAVGLLREASHLVDSLRLPLVELWGIAPTRWTQLHRIPGLLAPRAIHPILETIAREDRLAPMLARHLHQHRQTEIDELQGQLVARGAIASISTPLLAQVITLIHQVEERSRFFTLEELERALRN